MMLLLTSFSIDVLCFCCCIWHSTLSVMKRMEIKNPLHLLLELGHLFKRQNNLCFCWLVIHTTWTARRLRFSLFFFLRCLVFKHNWGFNGRSLIRLRVRLFDVSAHKLALNCFFSFTAALLQCSLTASSTECVKEGLTRRQNFFTFVFCKLLMLSSSYPPLKSTLCDS